MAASSLILASRLLRLALVGGSYQLDLQVLVVVRMHRTLVGELDLLAGLGRLDHPEDRFGRSHSPPAGMEHRLAVHHRVVHLVDLAAVVHAGDALHHAEAIVVVDPYGALPTDPHVAALARHNQGAGVARIVEAGPAIR